MSFRNGCLIRSRRPRPVWALPRHGFGGVAAGGAQRAIRRSTAAVWFGPPIPLARPEEEVDLIAVMRPAPQTEVVGRGLSAHRLRIDMMELEAPPRSAASTIRAHEGTPLVVPHRHLASGVHRLMRTS